MFAEVSTVHVSLGLHPEVAVAKRSEEGLLVQLVASAQFVGEIGLDGSSRFKESLSLQERIFSSVVAECEQQGGRIMSIHSRGAEARVLDILQAHPRAGTAVLHWFSGSRRDLRRAIEMGCWFSVGPSMLAGAKGRAHFAEMPLNRLLPETDGPFAKRRGVPLMPWEASDIRRDIEARTGSTSAHVDEILRGNLRALLAASAERASKSSDVLSGRREDINR
jgi:TatD DNase family protein